ncbi:MAG: UDP-2,3-diacylglucosamine diphosphatase [Bacteroidota bacterium]|nr:UDP-2,3-diacylglucosamine diphosphatase [Bacteroidota bacterium]
MDKEKIYFASDFHLGSPNFKESRIRENLIINWLNDIKKDAKAIYLLGDIFDFWFEYKKVVPKGYIRFLSKLAEIVESGTEIHFFVGNHDLWAKDYLEVELGLNIHHHQKIIKEQNKKLLIAHGDGLGKADYTYKLIKKIFKSRICQWIFSQLHPNLAFTVAQNWSKKSRKKISKPFLSKEKEVLFNYCKNLQKKNPVDYYVMGHRHLPLEIKIDEQAKYINLGEWINYNTYAVLENGIIKLNTYKKNHH